MNRRQFLKLTGGAGAAAAMAAVGLNHQQKQENGKWTVFMNRARVADGLTSEQVDDIMRLDSDLWAIRRVEDTKPQSWEVRQWLAQPPTTTSYEMRLQA